MFRAAWRRGARALATLVVAFLVCFLLLHAMPGDPADRLDSPSIPAEQAERNRKALGLDLPPAEQLMRTVMSYARGDLGVSTSRMRPVSSVLVESLPYTAMLGLTTLILAYGVGLPLALWLVSMAPRKRRALDSLLLGLAVVPRFLLGVLLVLLFHGVAGWFPASHAFSPGGGDWLDRLWHLVLPSITLGLPAIAVVARYQMTVMQQVARSPHVRAARAAGGGGLTLLWNHVARPSLGPAIALFVLDLPVLVSGAIVVEVIFAWPGLGRLTAEAVLGADYPLALAAVTLSTMIVIGGRLVAGQAVRAVYPAQRSAEEAGR